MKFEPRRLLISSTVVVMEGLDRLRGGVGLTTRLPGAQALLTGGARVGRFRAGVEGRGAVACAGRVGRLGLPFVYRRSRAASISSDVRGLICGI